MPDPRRDEAALLRFMQYLRKPRRVADIRKDFDLSERSAYRWMSYLRDANQEIVSKREDGVALFWIIGETV